MAYVHLGPTFSLNVWSAVALTHSTSYCGCWPFQGCSLVRSGPVGSNDGEGEGNGEGDLSRQRLTVQAHLNVCKAPRVANHLQPYSTNKLGDKIENST